MRSLKQLITNIFQTKKEEPTKTVEQGNVKFFNNTKGFGFITTTNSKEEIFVHKSGLVDRIKKEDKVLFETESTSKGVNAINVRLA